MSGEDTGDDTQSDLLGREPVIQAVRIVNTQQRVDVRQDAERVLGKFPAKPSYWVAMVVAQSVSGVAPLNVRPSDCRYRPGNRARMPPFGLPAAHNTNDGLIRTRRDAGRQACQMAHFQGGDRRPETQSPQRKSNAGRQFKRMIAVKIAAPSATDYRRSAGDAGSRLKLRGRVQAGNDSPSSGCDVASGDLAACRRAVAGFRESAPRPPDPTPTRRNAVSTSAALAASASTYQPRCGARARNRS